MKISEIAPPGREKQVKKLKKKFDDPGAPYAIAWAQHNKHGKPKKKESIGSSEYSEVKAILDKHSIKSSDDVELGSAVYDELFDYFANSGEMPYGVMKARTGMPDEWIADRLDDLGLVEQDVPTQKGRDAKPDVLTPRAMNVVKKQIKKDANKQRRADSKKAVDVEEAPFGSAVKSAIGRAVNRAGTKVKKAVGSVPGLGDLKTSAKAQQNIMQIADKTWQEFLQYKQSNPTDDQMTKWFKDRGMEIDSPDQANKDTVIQGVKAGIAQAGGGPAKTSQDQTQQKDKFNLSQLQKIEPTATPKTIRAIAQAKAGKTVQGELAVAMQPLMTKFANALQNPTKRQRLAVALAESLSQSDLSKLDMLAREGMVPKNKVSRFKTAMRTLAKGKDLPISYKDDVIDVVTKLAKIITKPSVMGMIRKGLRENQDPKNTFDKWVKKGKEEHNI